MKNIHKINENIYITSDEEIKEGEWYENNGVIFKADDVFDEGNNPNNSNPRVTDFNNKIILTTDQDLIKDGVQSISDEFLQWFVKNPSCEEVEVILNEVSYFIEDNIYKIIIPKEEPTAYHYLSCCRSVEECHCGKYPKQIKCYCGHTTTCDCSPIDEHKQETLEEFAKREAKKFYDNGGSFTDLIILGAKWQQERMYSEEDMKQAYLDGCKIKLTNIYHLEKWFEKFKKK